MSQTIWKFPLPIRDMVSLTMPVGAKVLSVAEQHGDLCLWAVVDDTAPRMERIFYVFGTGNPIVGVGTSRFVGTVLMAPFVWHIFEAV
jgi:hypothetical protein